jgi:hypothetical protein
MDAKTRILGKAEALIAITLIALLITTALFFADLSHHCLNVILATSGMTQIVILLYQLAILDKLQKSNTSSTFASDL